VRTGRLLAGLLVLAPACVTERVLEPRPDPLGGRALLEALVEGRSAAPRPDVLAAPPSRWGDLRARHDSDGDGQVTPAELAPRDLQRFDRDRDGLVSLADFPVEAGAVSGPVEATLVRGVAARALERALGDPERPGSAVAETWRARFVVLDLDRDLRLSRAEFEAAAGSTTRGRDAFGAVLDCFDRDDDDQLGWLELELR
jgi:hypothetical protein